jgi:hypothetical protein
MNHPNYFRDLNSKNDPQKYDIFGLGKMIPHLVLFFFSTLTKDMGGNLSCD